MIRPRNAITAIRSVPLAIVVALLSASMLAGCTSTNYSTETVVATAERVSTDIPIYDSVLTNTELHLQRHRSRFDEPTWSAIQAVIDDVHAIRALSVAWDGGTASEKEAVAADMSRLISDLVIDYEVAYRQIAPDIERMPPDLQVNLRDFHAQAIQIKRTLLPTTEPPSDADLLQCIDRTLYWAHAATQLLSILTAPPPS